MQSSVFVEAVLLLAKDETISFKWGVKWFEDCSLRLIQPVQLLFNFLIIEKQTGAGYFDLLLSKRLAH